MLSSTKASRRWIDETVASQLVSRRDAKPVVSKADRKRSLLFLFAEKAAKGSSGTAGSTSRATGRSCASLAQALRHAAKIGKENGSRRCAGKSKGDAAAAFDPPPPVNEESAPVIAPATLPAASFAIILPLSLFSALTAAFPVTVPIEGTIKSTLFALVPPGIHVDIGAEFLDLSIVAAAAIAAESGEGRERAQLLLQIETGKISIR